MKVSTLNENCAACVLAWLHVDTYVASIGLCQRVCHFERLRSRLEYLFAGRCVGIASWVPLTAQRLLLLSGSGYGKLLEALHEALTNSYVAQIDHLDLLLR